MASDVLFDVDASQILAKLHLAGLQPLKMDLNKEFIVNTGIKNDDPHADPAKPGKVTFDLKNSTGEYEVGYVTEIAYKRDFKTDAPKSIDAIDKQVSELEALINKITDTKIKDKPDEKDIAKRNELTNTILTTIGSKDTKKEIASLEDVGEIKKEIDKWKKGKPDLQINDESGAEVDKGREANSKEYDLVVSRAREVARSHLETYMKVFAGEGATKDLANNIAEIEISPNIKNSNDSSLVKMFEIVPISDAEHSKLIAQFRANYEKDPNKDNCVQKICFKIKYDLTVDK